MMLSYLEPASYMLHQEVIPQILVACSALTLLLMYMQEYTSGCIIILCIIILGHIYMHYYFRALSPPRKMPWTSELDKHLK